MGAGCHTEVVGLFLDKHDINVNQARGDGVTPLLVASHNGYTEIVRLLLDQDDIAINQAAKLDLIHY